MPDLILAALALQAAPGPDLTDPYNRALADWAACARYHVELSAASSHRRDIGVVDEAMRHCLDEEAEVRERVREQSGAGHAQTMRQILARFREAMHRHLRRQHRR